MPTLSVQPSDQVPYFTPKQPLLGQFIKYKDNPQSTDQPPPLFRPLTIRNVTFPNRIGVSPMATYSSHNSLPTDFHLVHYGAWASRGPGLVLVECSAIDPDGALSTNDLGLWTHHQAQAHRDKIVSFAHSQNSRIGVQLGHCARKAELQADRDERESLLRPHELSADQLPALVARWGEAARLAVDTAGYDFVEIQAGHGHLLGHFLDRDLNRRTDQYGAGDFASRTRLLAAVVREVRRCVGEGVPVFVRVSVGPGPVPPKGSRGGSRPSDDDIARLAVLLADCGADVLDVAGGGTRVNEMRPAAGQAHPQADGSRVLVAASGGVRTAAQAEDVFLREHLDLLLVGKPFLEHPGLVWAWANELGVAIHEAVQYTWGSFPDREHQQEERAPLGR